VALQQLRGRHASLAAIVRDDLPDFPAEVKTQMPALAPSFTSAQASMVTTAVPRICRVPWTRWVTPSPAQVSFATMSPAAWMTSVPFGRPQATGAVTVTVAEPLLDVSATLVAVMVKVVGVAGGMAVKVALLPFGVSVPPEAVQVRPVLQPAVAASVAVSVAVPPAGMEGGLAFTVTPVTVQVAAGVTVTVAEPNLEVSATLVAVMV